MSEKPSKKIVVRVTEEEFDKIKTAAKDKGVPPGRLLVDHYLGSSE